MFGSHLDLHSGGVDLAFPHHHNEILQCNAWREATRHSLPSGEAAVQPHGWCSVFAHAGHLHIAGRKMSKSLKNFTSVRSFFDDMGYTANNFRFFCLSHRYRSHITFSEVSSLLSNVSNNTGVFLSFLLFLFFDVKFCPRTGVFQHRIGCAMHLL